MIVYSDDNSAMRAHLKHIGTHTGGKLPLDVSQPTFLCDPSHRVKGYDEGNLQTSFGK